MGIDLVRLVVFIMSIYFDKDIYNQCDYMAWECLSKQLNIFELKPYHETEDFGIDTMIYHYGTHKLLQLELEVLLGWEGEKFPWKRINHLDRKVSKYFDIPNSYYIQFNNDCSYCAVTNFKDCFNPLNIRHNVRCKLKNGGYRYDTLYNNSLHKTIFLPIHEIELFFLNEVIFGEVI